MSRVVTQHPGQPGHTLLRWTNLHGEPRSYQCPDDEVAEVVAMLESAGTDAEGRPCPQGVS